MRRLIRLSALVGGMCVAGAISTRPRGADATQPAAAYQMSDPIHVGGAGRWDYITCDPDSHRLFVPRSDHTQIIDASSGKILADIHETPNSHGVALAPECNRGFISDSKGVTVFDLKDLKPLGAIAAGVGSDAVIYDPASKCVVVMNGRSSNVSFIDAAAPIESAKAVNVALEGRPEFAAADGAGKVYINLEDKSEIAVVDSKEKKLIARWKIEGGEEPSGLAIDVAHHRLFSGCHNQVMAVIDTESGKTVATVPIGNGVDACAFDPGTGEAFASCGDSTVTVAKETGDDKFAVSTIHTKPAARTMTVDPTTHTLYLPTAEMTPPTTQSTGGGGGGGGGRRPRMQMKPDSFMIVVVKPG